MSTDLADGAVDLTIDGTQDIMATSGGEGNKTSPFSPFAFNHLLAQLEFKVVPADGVTAAVVQTLFGKVTKIQIENQVKDLTLTLLGNQPALAKQASATETNLFTINAANSGIEIDTDAMLGNVLIYPEATLGQTGKKISLKVYTELGVIEGYSVTAMIGAGTTSLEASKKYIITLKFSSSEVTGVVSSVGPWGDGAAGSGDTDIN